MQRLESYKNYINSLDIDNVLIGYYLVELNPPNQRCFCTLSTVMYKHYLCYVFLLKVLNLINSYYNMVKSDFANNLFLVSG